MGGRKATAGGTHGDLLQAGGEYAELIGPVKRGLEAEYQLSFGQKEQRLLEVQLQFQRMKREISIRQQAINHGKSLEDDEVKAVLDEEFREYARKVEEAAAKVKAAQALFTGEKLSSSAIKELKRIFHKLAKMLHPDLNPNLPPVAEELWHRALEAYKANNLPELRLVEDMAEELVAGKDLQPETQGALEELRRRTLALEEKIAEIQTRIAQVQKEFPFTEKDLLCSVEAVRARRAELDAQRAQWQEHLEALAEMLRVLRQGGMTNE